MGRRVGTWLWPALAIAALYGCDSGRSGMHDDSGTASGFTSAHFSGAEQCTLCHDGISDQGGNDISLVRSWSASMMANSAVDPFYQAKVASEAYRASSLAGEIEATCSRCHAPMAHVEASFERQTPSLFDYGFLNADNPYHAAAREGVSCTLCHQIKDTADLGEPTSFDGGFTIPDEIGTNRLLAGSLSAPLTRPMQEQVGFTPVQSAHMGKSELCGTCHNLATEVIDVNEQPTGGHFQEQAIYSEWEHSTFGKNRTKECQDCHMGEYDGVVVSTRPRQLNARNGVSGHRFSGGNTVMLNILASNKDSLGALGDDFASAIAANRSLLHSAAVLTIATPTLTPEALAFTVKVENRSGHKLPAGYPSRRVFLHVTVTNNAGQVVFESGDRQGGRLIGGDADSDRSMHEPHHELITSEDQVQIYEAVMKNSEGALTYTLLRAAGYQKDNRLLPEGFDKMTAPDTVKVVGAAKGDNDFAGGTDSVQFQISAATLGVGPYYVDAELIYQPLGYPYVQDLFVDRADVVQVELFAGLYEKAAFLTETLATAQARTAP